MSGSSDKSWWEYSNWIKLLARNSRITNPTGNEENEIRRFVQFIYDPARNEGLRPWLKDNFFKKSQAVGGQQFPLNNFSQAKVVVLNWSQLSGAILTITIPSEGVFTFEEGIDWFITSNNNETAKSLYSAIINSFAPVITLLNNNGIIIQSLISGEDGDLNTITTSDPVNLKISGDNFEGGSATNLQKIYVVVEMLELVGRDLKKIPLRDNEAELVDRLFPFTGNRRLGTKYLYGNIGGNGLSLVEEGGTTELPVESTTDLPVESTTSLPIESTTSLPIESTTSLPEGTTNTPDFGSTEFDDLTIFEVLDCDGFVEHYVSATTEQMSVGQFWLSADCVFVNGINEEATLSISFDAFVNNFGYSLNQEPCCSFGTTEFPFGEPIVITESRQCFETLDILPFVAEDCLTSDEILFESVGSIEVYDSPEFDNQINRIQPFPPGSNATYFIPEDGTYYFLLIPINSGGNEVQYCVSKVPPLNTTLLGTTELPTTMLPTTDIGTTDIGTTDSLGTTMLPTTEIGTTDIGTTEILLQLFELYDCNGVFQTKVFAEEEGLMDIGEFWLNGSDCLNVGNYSEDFSSAIGFDQFISLGFELVDDCCDLGTTEMDGTSSGVGFTKFELVNCDGLFQAVILAPIDEMFIGQFWNDSKGDCWEVKTFTEEESSMEYSEFLSAGFTEVPNCCP